MSDNSDAKKEVLLNDDPTAVSRKRDHIELAFQSQVETGKLDQRFSYEPLLSGHPDQTSISHIPFLQKTLRTPIWVSSMTGGTELAGTINHNLARACNDFGMGMGLGSCRALLYDDAHFDDFNIRPIMGNGLPLYANLGIAQMETVLRNGQVDLVFKMLDKLQADGLIIHVNPLQEWLQPEGDHFEQPPLETITQYLELADRPVIVKEVGQGMGYESLKALLQLPLEAIDFAANGGTNFAKLELLRSNEQERLVYGALANVGHGATEMVHLTNRVINEFGDRLQCKQVIISGGIKNFLDGYYLINSVNLPAIYGQASAFLKYARGDYQTLRQYVQSQMEGLALANAFLKVKK